MALLRRKGPFNRGPFTGALPPSPPQQPIPSGAEYCYGSQGAMLTQGGYGVVFAMAAALLSVATAVPKKAFAQTVPQTPVYQPSNVNSASPALFAVAVAQKPFSQILGQRQESGGYIPAAFYSVQPPTGTFFLAFTLEGWQDPPPYQASSIWGALPSSGTAPKPVIASILGQPQYDLSTPASAVYTTTQTTQRPLFTAVLTSAQADLSYPRSAVFGLTAATGLQTPSLRTQIQTWPQDAPENRPSAVYAQLRPVAAAATPPLRGAILTAAEWPQIGPSSVSTTNIALALAAPSLRGSIGTVAEQPLSVRSWTVVNTALLPSLALTPPPLRPIVLTVPQLDLHRNPSFVWRGPTFFPAPVIVGTTIVQSFAFKIVTRQTTVTTQSSSGSSWTADSGSVTADSAVFEASGGTPLTVIGVVDFNYTLTLTEPFQDAFKIVKPDFSYTLTLTEPFQDAFKIVTRETIVSVSSSSSTVWTADSASITADSALVDASGATIATNISVVDFSFTIKVNT